MSKVHELHKSAAPQSVGIFIVTCSTSRYNQLRAGQKPDDASGDAIERLALSAGDRIEGRRLIPDSKSTITRTAKEALRGSGVQALIITGGTGLSPRDVTIESIHPQVEKEIPGFGELFRKLSYETIGPPALLSRAFAGTRKGKVIFCLPGSPDAVQTAMEKLILPELGHIIRVANEH
jgi:molybdenum cofactor biosynthesis protein B